jgi:hypothetical protein
MPKYTEVGTYTGIEYTLNKNAGSWNPDPITVDDEDGDEIDFVSHGSPEPFTWQGVSMQFPDPTVVESGFDVSCKYYVATVTKSPIVTDPDTGEESGGELGLSVVYPNWTLNEQTLTFSGSNFFFVLKSTDNFINQLPGSMGIATSSISETVTAPPLPPIPMPDVNDPDYVPTIHDNAYSYVRIFDESIVDFYPRLSPASQSVLKSPEANLPSEPYLPQGREQPSGLTITQPGTGFVNVRRNLPVLGGSGTGMRVDTFARNGSVYQVKFRNRGTGYLQGDAVRVQSPGLNLRMTVENPPEYPIDGIVGFVPDERETVTINFTLTTKYNGNVTDTINIQQTISQAELNITEKLRGVMEASYWGNGYYHTGLYPPGQEPVWTSDGRTIPNSPANYPHHLIQMTRKSYPYDNNTEEFISAPENNPNT